MKCFQLNKTNCFVILIVLIISFISGFHHLAGYFVHGGNYSPFFPGGSFSLLEEAYAYMSRTRQIINGSLFPHDSHIFEHQGSPTPFIGEALPTYIMALFSLIFGSVEKGFIAADFVLPPLIFLIVFYFTKYLTKNNLLSIAVSLCFIFVRDFFIYFPYPVSTLKFLYLQEISINDLVITRSFHPQVSVIFFLLALISTYLALEKQKKVYIILAGVLTGLIFYDYIYYSTSFIFGLFILFLFTIKNHNRRKIIITIVFIGLIIAIPYIINYIRFYVSPLSADFVQRVTSTRDKFPLPRAIRFLVLTPVLFLLIWKKDFKFYFFNSFIFAAALLPDLTFLISGRDLESNHWVWVAVLPLATIYYPILIENKVFKFFHKNLKKTIYILASLSFIFYGYKIQMHSAFKYVPDQKHNIDETGLFQYLKTRPRDSVIANYPEYPHPGDKNIYIPAFTNNLIFTPYSTLTVASSKEIIERNMILLRFIKSAKEIKKQDLDSLIESVYTGLNAPKQKKKRNEIKKQLINELYNFDNYCKKYKIDYLITNSKSKINRNCFSLTETYSNNKYSVYKVSNNESKK